MDRAYRVRRPEVPFQQLQQAAKPLRSPFHERKEHGELRDLALTGADTAGGLRPPRRCQLFRERGEPVLQRGSAHFRRVGVKLPHLLNLLLDDRVAFGFVRYCVCVAMTAFSFRFARSVCADLADLVEKFVDRFADALKPSGVHHGQIRIGDVPRIRRI